MRYTIVVFVMLAALACSAQQPAESASAVPPSPASKGCLAVKPVGSHAFRNVMLLGVTGALISKQQYQVLSVKDYPSHVGQKYHGNDLQTIQGGGTRVVIMDKKYSSEELENACK
jgi:hypothetical protein